MKLLGEKSIKSDAFNFLSFISSGVDARTGTYSCSVSLPHVTANALAGPSLPLSLSFNALSRSNTGFGVGWSLSLTRYDSASKTLTLSSGASYEALVSTTGFSMTDKKVRDIQTRRVGDELFVEHKSGLLEVLSNPGMNSHEWLLSAVYSAEGHRLRLIYGFHAGRRYLAEMRDDQQRLLLVTLGGASATRITLWPDSESRQVSFQLQLLNNQLMAISARAGNEPLATWNFKYITMQGMLLISELRLPTGGIERLNYRPSAMGLPSDAPVKALPAVSRHTVIPGSNQPPMVREYAYSVNNYLGNGSRSPWHSQRDNLHSAVGNYEYWSLESLMMGSGATSKVIRRVRRTYNRFHLLVAEETSQNGCVVAKKTEYHQQAGLTFKQQPPNFQLPAREVTTYYRTDAPEVSRSDTTVTEFDDFGNLTRKVTPSGVTELYEYYPAQGADGCPADPLRMVRWLRTKTVMPAVGHAAAQIITTHYRYVELGSASKQRASFIALHRESAVVDASPMAAEKGAVFRSIQWEYHQHPSSVFHGRVARKVETINSVDTVFDYVRGYDAGVLVTGTTMSCLGVKSTRSVEQDALSGVELAVTDANGVLIEATYDRLGRKTCEAIAPRTPSQVLKRFEHHLSQRSEDIAQTITVAVSGAEKRTRVDGLNREVSIQTEDIDQPGRPLRVVYEATYDALGQLELERHIDWLDGEARYLETRHHYDDWGNRTSSLGPDQVISHDQIDPVSLTRTQWQEGGGRTVTFTNTFGKDERVERYDRHGNACGVTQFVYDGLGRCISKTDTRGFVTRYAYDFANRLLTSVLADGAIVSRRYIPHSLEDLTAEITVDDYRAGEREFDGLLRVSHTTVGRRTERFTYQGASPDPQTHTKASGIIVGYEYDPVLNHQMLQRDVTGNAGLAASYRYDSIHARLVEASTPDNQQARSHTASGQIKNEVTLDGSQRFEATRRYSLQKRPLAYTNAVGVKQINRYDTSGRVSGIQQGHVNATFQYNRLGRISRIHAQDNQSKQSFTTLLEYDDFGRETRRALIPENGEPELIEQRFGLDNRLIQRKLTRGKLLVRDERYQYDARGRLTVYRCAGSHPPEDPYGNAVVAQTYTFDALDNIRELVTEFPTGQNVARYRYDHVDKTQLSQVEHSHPDYANANMTFEYDLDGHQLNSHNGQRFSYDALGRMSSVQEGAGDSAADLISYRYDALDRLIGMTAQNSSPVNRFFHDGSVAAQIHNERHESYLREKSLLIAYSSGRGADLQSTLLGTDQHASVLLSLGPQGRQRSVYTAYGHRLASDGLHSLLGFNSEHVDPVTGCYMLGNGYRAYNPILMRFHSPDSMSPFGAGGINPYLYCLGDPINSSDPSGHFSWLAVLGIAIAVASIAITIATLGASLPATGPSAVGGISLSTAAAVIDIAANVVGIAATITQEVAPQSKAGSILGYVSIGLGGASFGTKQLAGSGIGAKLGKASVGTSLQRQNAVRVPQAAKLSFFQSAATGAGARNNVVISERLSKATELLSYVDYSVTVCEGFNDYILPALRPDTAPSNSEVSDPAAGQNGYQGLLGAANESAQSSVSDSLERMESIRDPG